MSVPDLRCAVCDRDLRAAGMLIRCRLCRAVLMCEEHVPATIEFPDAPGVAQPVCRGCLIRAAHRVGGES